VADELERRWNCALERVAELEARITKEKCQRVVLELPSSEQLVRLAENLEQVWGDPEFDVRLKKRIVRIVLQEVMVDVCPEHGEIRLVLNRRQSASRKIRSTSPRRERKLAARNFRPAFCNCFLAARSPSAPCRRGKGITALAPARSLGEKMRPDGAERSEGVTVDRTGAALLEGRKMLLGPVTFVAGKTVAGILAVKLHHQAVAGYFGENAGGGDGIAQGVAGHDGGLREGKSLDAEAIHQNVLGRRIQSGQRQVHGAMGRLENVDLINERRVHLGDAEANFRAGNQPGVKNLPPPRGKQFAIVDLLQSFGQAPQNPICRENDRCGHDRPGQGTAARFVHPGDASETLAQKFRFKTEIRRLGCSCWHERYFRAKRRPRATLFFRAFVASSHTYVLPSVRIAPFRENFATDGH